MMKNKRKELESILKDLKKVTNVVGSLIARRDGLLLMSDLPPKINSFAIAAMSAAMSGTSEMSVKELGMGRFDHVVIHASKNEYISIGAGKEAILVSLLKKGANIGLVLLEMDRIAEKISKMM